MLFRSTWNNLTTWVTWPTGGIAEPIYYDYGPGGNVVYQNNNVYVNNEPVATAGEFAESAADLATVPPPPSDEVAAQSDWKPLGTFALSANENESDPHRILQLAINQQGIISGTLYNTENDQAKTIEGRVDPQTQRVAFRIGENENIVAETGLYDLTQNEVPLLIHFGADRTENYLLVRLDYPGDDNGNAGSQLP